MTEHHPSPAETSNPQHKSNDNQQTAEELVAILRAEDHGIPLPEEPAHDHPDVPDANIDDLEIPDLPRTPLSEIEPPDDEAGTAEAITELTDTVLGQAALIEQQGQALEGSKRDLTGLLNETGFDLELQSRFGISEKEPDYFNAKREADKKPKRILVVFADVCSLRDINNNIGHPTGDSLLAQVGKDLNDIYDATFRPGDGVLGHVHGDEFMMVLEVPNFDDPAKEQEWIESRMARFTDVIGKPRQQPIQEFIEEYAAAKAAGEKLPEMPEPMVAIGWAVGDLRPLTDNDKDIYGLLPGENPDHPKKLKPATTYQDIRQQADNKMYIHKRWLKIESGEADALSTDHPEK